MGMRACSKTFPLAQKRTSETSEQGMIKLDLIAPSLSLSISLRCRKKNPESEWPILSEVLLSREREVEARLLLMPGPLGSVVASAIYLRFKPLLLLSKRHSREFAPLKGSFNPHFNFKGS